MASLIRSSHPHLKFNSIYPRVNPYSFNMKLANIISALILTGTAAAAAAAKYPTTVIAGVEVIDTPIVRSARQLIEVFEPLQPYLVKHLYRTWLFGAAAINANETLKSSLDLELHAVGTLLHDLGWDMRPDSPWVTKDQRFETDSGISAVNWVKSQNCASQAWDEIRLERMYDGIALQTEHSIASGKNLQSQWIVNSVGFEFPGKSPLIPDEDYYNILAAYPNHYLFRGTNATFTWLAETKPNGTYNNFIQGFGLHYVAGFNITGKTMFDSIYNAAVTEQSEYPNATIFS
ncbi:hypothetical protein GGR50DRAFT_674925 [Xylaria sp. CBS 124048]|nr:hypothetical protein GGR50DRAFT_674925 [Xylaria sp. CBS 124048]